MKIEIIMVGDGIFRQNGVRANVTFISEKLKEKGYGIDLHFVLSDESHLFRLGMEQALCRSDLVITMGGLGSNLDNKRRKVIANLFNVRLLLHKEIEKDLTDRFGFFSTLKEQATVFEGCHYFLNRVGTSPGMILKKGEKTLILLPGELLDLHEMFGEVVIWIEKNFPLKEYFYQEKICLFLLSEPLVAAYLRELASTDSTVEMGISPSSGFLQVHFSSRDKEGIQQLKTKICEKFTSFHCPSPTIEEAIQNALLKKGKTLALAESCSGGLMATRLTALPGASRYFLGSIVSYSNELKRDILGVSEHTLMKYGAVSQEVANEMVNGLFEHTTADYAVAITGLAGPGKGTEEKSVGTIYIAIGEREGRTDSGMIHSQDSRSRIVAYAVNTAFGALWRRIVHNERTFE